MLKRKSRFATILVLLSLVSLVLPFNTSFAGYNPTVYACENTGVIQIDKSYEKLPDNMEVPPKAVFNLYSKAKGGSKVGSITFPDNNRFTGLEPGKTYYLSEKSMDNFTSDLKDRTPVQAVDPEESTLVPVAVMNTYHNPGIIKIFKTYKGVPRGMSKPPATFNLYADEGGEVLVDSITWPDEKVFTGLELGVTYYLGEDMTGESMANFTSSLQGLVPVEANSSRWAKPVLVRNTYHFHEDGDGVIKIDKSYKDLPEGMDAPAATFNLYSDEDGTQLVDSITWPEENTFDGLQLETPYYLSEDMTAEGMENFTTDLPALKPVTAVDPKKYEVVPAVAVVNTYQEPGDGVIKITKRYANLPEGMDAPAATFNLYSDADGTQLVDSITWPEENTFDGLQLETPYYLSEDMTTEGMEYFDTDLDPLTEVFAVQETEENPAEPVAVINTYRAGSITVYKSYGDQNPPLLYSTVSLVPGPTATFTLYGEDKETVLKTESLSGPGSITFEQLPTGTYYLLEDAPPGYHGVVNTGDGVHVISSDLYRVDVTADNPETVQNDELNPYIYVTNVENEGGIIRIHKTFNRGTPVAVKFNLYTKVEGEYVLNTSGSTDADTGLLYFDNLDPEQTYYLSEVVPSRYRSSLENYTELKFSGEINSDRVSYDSEENMINVEVLNTRRSSGGGGGETVTSEEPQPGTPPEQPVIPPVAPPAAPPEVIVPEQPEIAVPTVELPKTGGNTLAYLLSGSFLTALGVFLRRFQK